MQIFISYRRDDASGEARNLYERLGSDLGQDNIFYDREAIRPAQQYRNIIEERLNTSDIVLVLIGEGWQAKLDERVQHLDDLHIREVRHALEASKVVMPVLLKRAQMPRAEQLPAELSGLARMQAISVRDDHWDSDVDRLISRIHELAPPTGLDAILKIVRKV